MSLITGTITPIKDKIIVSEMHFGNERSPGGLFLLSDDGKGQGIKPRWAKVWAVGPEQVDVKVGEWILIEHGRWTRTIEYETESGEKLELRAVDNDAVLLSMDYRPSDIQRNIAAGPGSNINMTMK